MYSSQVVHVVEKGSVYLRMAYVRVPAAKVLRALVARFLFAAHGLVCIWRVSSIYKSSIFWLLGFILVLIFIEGALLILYRQANESRWFCTSVFLYLCAVAPSLWFLQLELCRSSIRDAAMNFTLNVSTMVEEIQGEAATFDFVGYKVTIYIPLVREVWVQVLQQTMLVTVILGRWILPKGDISRDHLSQLLLLFLAMAADMVELFDTFKETQVKYNIRLTCVVLAVWTISVVQFSLVLTGRANGYPSNKLHSSRPSRSSSIHQQEHIYPTLENPSFCAVVTTDITFWSVLACTFLQDGPFLATRLYLLIAHQTISYTMIFFTCKNVLVVALQFYRLFVICIETSKTMRTSAQMSAVPSPRMNSFACKLTEFTTNEGYRLTNTATCPSPLTMPTAIFVDNGNGRKAAVLALKPSCSDGALLLPTEFNNGGKKIPVSSRSELSDSASLRDL